MYDNMAKGRVVHMEYDLPRVAREVAFKATQKYVHKDALDMVNFYLITFNSALEEIADSPT